MPRDATSIDTTSPEFQSAVETAVLRALAAIPVAAVSTVAVPSQAPVVIPGTSIDTTRGGLDDLTVRFNRFCTHQNMGYQRMQQAGFPRAAAEALAASGTASIVHDPRRAA